MRKEVAYFLAAALTFAHRALAAALILAIPAAEIFRLGRTPPALTCVLFCFAQRARWAAAMRLSPVQRDNTQFTINPSVGFAAYWPALGWLIREGHTCSGD